MESFENIEYQEDINMRAENSMEILGDHFRYFRELEREFEVLKTKLGTDYWRAPEHDEYIDYHPDMVDFWLEKALTPIAKAGILRDAIKFYKSILPAQV